jgi:hypothetical protein
LRSIANCSSTARQYIPMATNSDQWVRSLMLLCLSSGFLLFKPRPILLGKLPIVVDAAL